MSTRPYRLSLRKRDPGCGHDAPLGFIVASYARKTEQLRSLAFYQSHGWEVYAWHINQGPPAKVRAENARVDRNPRRTRAR